MVILGGLEFVAGGYLLHRYNKNKNEKKRLQAEAHERRHYTFPAAKPHSCYAYQQQPYQHPQYQQPPYQHIPQQKYTYHAPQPQPQPSLQPQHRVQPRPHGLPHTASFEIPRRPVPPPQPQQQPPPLIIQPLQRADSFATISRMPIANGYRPSDVESHPPALPPRQDSSSLSPIPQSPYSTAAFSRSSPALGPPPLTPTTPVYASPHFGRQTVDDNWETFAPHAGPPAHGHYAPSVSTALGEDDPNDPPPPYIP
jgi:hypothetical protein